MDVLREIKANLEYMSSAEQKIAQLILDDVKKFTGYTLSEVSERAKVSQGSVVNFANKFVGGGFPKLKIALATCAVDNEEFLSDGVKTDSMKEILKNTQKNISEGLLNTLSLNDEQVLKSVAERILKAKKVEIYGIYRSAVVATDFYYQLVQTGIPANFVSDVLTCAVSASMLDKGSLVVAISSSGQTQDVIDAVKIAKSNGVDVVCITAHKNSPLAKLCDDVLIASPSGNSNLTMQTEIRISQLAVTDAICAYLRKKTVNINKYFEVEDILNLHNVRD